MSFFLIQAGCVLYVFAFFACVGELLSLIKREQIWPRALFSLAGLAILWIVLLFARLFFVQLDGFQDPIYYAAPMFLAFHPMFVGLFFLTRRLHRT